MTPIALSWHLHADLLAGAAAVAVLATFAALSLMRDIAVAGAGARLRRCISASVALATGAWSAHFIVMSGESLPGAPGYHAATLLAAFGLALAGALAAQALILGPTRSPARLTLAACTLGGALCAVPVVALLALRMASPIEWNIATLATAWALGSVGAGATFALAQFARSAPNLGYASRHRSALASLALGATVVAVNGVVLVAARVAASDLASPAGFVAGEALTMLALLGAPAVLALLLLASVLERRFGDLLALTRDELQRAATTDPLTSLPNRIMFEDRLARAVQRADRANQRLALLFVNLDGLKGVNEGFGQSAGDALLRIVGQRMRALGGGREMLARVGGDEFLLLLEDNPAPTTVAHHATRLLEEIARPCTVEHRELSVSASIGIAMYPEHGALARLVPHAAAALQAAKHQGGATFCFFEASMLGGKREELELLRDLRRATEQRELELFYQPKIHAPSGEITGAEALMRWHHPKRGMIGPDVFIPLAEQYGLINAMGNWLIDDACRQIRAWRNEGLRMRVAINLSVHQLRQTDLATRVSAALKRHRLEPEVLTCEITETVATDDSHDTQGVIEQLAALGVHLSIDDFGSGYSNLSRLRKLPAHELKIDRGLVLDLESSADAHAIVDAVIKLAQAIGLKVVAEGVETEAQQHLLRLLGCDELQGYLFARPMPARALAQWAMNQEGPRALDFRASLFGETRAVDLA